MRSLNWIALATLLLAGCDASEAPTKISTSGKNAESVYLTQDHENNPVVVWTEKEEPGRTLYYAVSRDNGATFLEPVSIRLTNDVATHAESMPKVAFKKDGTIFAAYEKKAPTEQNKYAGAIYYVASSDRGKTWTPERFLHSDTVAGRSRSYFDIERLPDGEIGAAWLDIKLNLETGGRSVRFAKTNGTVFSGEVLVDSSACQCCRIDVYGDLSGRINVAYRGLAKGTMGRSIRDMMLATSKDGGRNFTTPRRISADDWAIDGCPHTGPSLCSNRTGLFFFWYTEGNGTGIYYNFTAAADSESGPRQLVSNNGRHPQASAGGSRFAMVWEENHDQADKTVTNILYQISDGDNTTRNFLSPREFNAYLPVITQTRDGFVVAFLMETQDGVGVYVTRI